MIDERFSDQVRLAPASTTHQRIAVGERFLYGIVPGIIWLTVDRLKVKFCSWLVSWDKP